MSTAVTTAQHVTASSRLTNHSTRNSQKPGNERKHAKDAKLAVEDKYGNQIILSFWLNQTKINQQ